MLVRCFQLSDYLEAVRLLEQSLSSECFEETLKVLKRQLSFDSKLVLLAELNGRVAGMIIGTIDGNKGYYYRIAVHPQYRRKGIGKTLIQELKKRFEMRKVSRIMIAVDAHNEPVLPVYAKAGYRPEDYAAPDALPLLKAR